MSRSRSQKPDDQTSQPSTSPPPAKRKEALEDPLFRTVSSMSAEAIGRSVGQVYYDLALREPSVVMGTAYEIGLRIKSLMINPEMDDWSPVWKPVVHRYMSESLVAQNPQAAAVAICRIGAVYEYCLGNN